MAELKAKKGRNYLTWTEEMDRALLEVLVEHHNNGDHAQNGWKPHVYNAAIRNVREKCNMDITKDNILARCKTFDKHYEVISKILSQSGFRWDWENNRLSMNSDDVWAKYVESNKVAVDYKTKVVKHWDAISLIYSKDHATGEGARTGVENAQERVQDGAALNSMESSPEPLAAGVSPILGKRQRTCDTIVSLLGDIRTSFQSAFKSTEPLQLPKVTSPAEILASLNQIPDLGRDNMLQAYSLFVCDDRLFNALLELPMEMRKDWVLMEIAKK